MKGNVDPRDTAGDSESSAKQRSTQMEDHYLLALILGKGTRQSRPGRKAKSWTAVTFAEDLYQAAGGQLSVLVQGTNCNALDLTQFGIGDSIGSRLIASMDLAHRWCEGFKHGGDSTLHGGAEAGFS